MLFRLRGYIDENGTKRYAKWFKSLNAIAATEVTITLTRMEKGNFSNAKNVAAEYSNTRLILAMAARKSAKTRTLRKRSVAGSITNGERKMPLTHDFKETIRARARTDPKYRQALLREAAESYLNGDLDTGKAVLRDYVNATVGFQALQDQTDIPAKSLMRMLGPKGSPSAANLSNILTALQKVEGVHFELTLRR